MSVPREQTIRPGMTLHWGPGVFDPAQFGAIVRALFVFSLADDAPEFPTSQMAFAADPALAVEPVIRSTTSFHVAVVLSDLGFRELLATDESVGARRLRQLGATAASQALVLSLTPAARFATESIRRCPFVGICREMALAARCNDLLVEFLTAFATAEAPSKPPLTRAVHDRIHAAAESFKRQLEEPPTLAVLARQVGLSETTLKRGFQQIFGTTVFGYLRERRMERAHALLQSGEATVLEAAASVGYSNPSNFAAAFRRQFGVNPKTFQLTARR